MKAYVVSKIEFAYDDETYYTPRVDTTGETPTVPVVAYKTKEKAEEGAAKRAFNYFRDLVIGTNTWVQLYHFCYDAEEIFTEEGCDIIGARRLDSDDTEFTEDEIAALFKECTLKFYTVTELELND